MDAKKHPEYSFENKRLANTQRGIDEYGKRFDDMEPTGTDDRTRSAHSSFIQERISLHKSQRHQPYFARIDFLESNKNSSSEWYIGFRALDLNEFEVFDWRAKVGRLLASSDSEDQSFGTTTGKLLLKRRFEIEGKLRTISDEFDRRGNISDGKKQVEFTSNEQFLLDQLYSRGDPRLKDIVKTIQKQQDDIIRSEYNRFIIINGVAGSGKTSIAIHRLAYLLFPDNSSNIRAQNSIVFCPNPIFLHYIEDLLPALGEKEVTQRTFSDWALDRIGYGSVKVIDTTSNRLSDPEITKKDRTTLSLRARAKGSLKFKNFLTAFVSELQSNYIKYPTENIVYPYRDENFALNFRFTPNEISDVILNAFEHSTRSLSEKRSRAWSDLRKLIRSKFDQLIENNVEAIKKESESIISNLENILVELKDPQGSNLIQAHIREISKKASNYRARALSIPITKNTIVATVEKFLIEEFNNIWPEPDTLGLYRYLFSDPMVLFNIPGNIFSFAELETFLGHQIKDNYFEKEDVAGLYILHDLIFGQDKRLFDHIVVDEIQDFSPLELNIIYEHSKNNSITFVGDPSQGIYSFRGLSDWNNTESIFGNNKPELINITQSYRSTVEIVNYSNRLLKNIGGNSNLAVPFNRNGEPPVEFPYKNGQEIIDGLIDNIEYLLDTGKNNIAVLTRTTKEANDLSQILEQKHIKTVQKRKLSPSDFKYDGGLIVLPVVLTKGLEFEAVIVFEANEKNYNSNNVSDGRLLYVAITRALHILYIVYTGQITGFLKE